MNTVADDKRMRASEAARVCRHQVQPHTQAVGHRTFLLWSNSGLLVSAPNFFLSGNLDGASCYGDRKTYGIF